MFTPPPREYIQALSTALLLMGLYLMTVLTSGWTGVSLVGLSCWVMLMSESILLSKVQGEMSSALESLRKKQELEVQDLLYYLRQSKLGDTRIVMLDISGNEHTGTIALIFLADMRSAVGIWLPDDLGILTKV